MIYNLDLDCIEFWNGTHWYNSCSSSPTCSDSIQNGDETGVDCGGADCVSCAARCSDGTQNGDETGVDCGGTSCYPCFISCGDTMYDARDGQVYNTVQIGNQCWMAENLNYGVMINSVNTGSTHSDQTNNATAEKYCYDNIASNCDTYGGLYEWDEMMQYTASSTSNPSGVQGLCPSGWHIPSDDEWTELENYLIANGYNYDGTTTGNKIAKSMASTTGWNTSSNPGAVGNNQSANNSSEFTALPGGYRTTVGDFYYLGNYGFFWSASESGASGAWNRYLYYANSSVTRNYFILQDGFSCRCVRD